MLEVEHGDALLLQPLQPLVVEANPGASAGAARPAACQVADVVEVGSEVADDPVHEVEALGERQSLPADWSTLCVARGTARTPGGSQGRLQGPPSRPRR